MKTISTKKIALLLSALFFAGSEMSFANSVSDSTDSKGNSGASSIAGKKKCGMCEKHASEKKIPATDAITIKPSENSYQPYLQFGGTRFFHLPESNTAGTVDLFVPIWQQDLTDLIFTDVRITDRSGTPFEGNIHLGYRHLFSESQQSLGFYGAFDRKKTALNNYFNQITVGGEYWIQNWFIGANYYQPIGAKTKELSPTYASNDVDYGVYRDVWLTKNFRNEKAMTGTDAEIGYEFIEGLVGYVGGYYFGASDVSTVAGPRARLTYDLSLKNNGRILGIFDKVGLETGVQHDKPRGTVWYLSANVRIGWLPDKKSALEGVSRHMVDPVRRDIDVVAGEATHKQDSKKYKIALIDADADDDAFSDAVKLAVDNDADIIDVNGTLTKDKATKLTDAFKNKKLWVATDEVLNFNLVGEHYKDNDLIKSGGTPASNKSLTRGKGHITEPAHDHLISHSHHHHAGAFANETEAAAKAEKERSDKKAAEQERLEKEAAEQERLKKEAAEQEKLKKEAVEQERLKKEAADKVEKERLDKEAADKVEKERLDKEAADKAEQERLDKEAIDKKAEKERLDKEAVEQERLKKEAALKPMRSLKEIRDEIKKVSRDPCTFRESPLSEAEKASISEEEQDDYLLAEGRYERKLLISHECPRH